MPLTFPSHAAVVLPLHRWSSGRLLLLPLIVGSAAPDFAYALRIHGGFSHSWLGVFAFCVPLGALTCVWLDRLLLPALRAAVPRLGPVDPARWLTSSGLPRSVGQAFWYGAAIALGAVTHVLWDGVTHDNLWPASVLYAGQGLDVLGTRISVANLLQYTSSLGGAAVVGVYAVRRYPKLPSVPAEGSRSTSLLWALILMAALGAAVSVWVHRRDLIDVGWKHVIWVSFWLAVRGVAAGWTLVAAFHAGVRRRRHARAHRADA